MRAKRKLSKNNGIRKKTMKPLVLILPISRYAYAARIFEKCDKPVNWIYLGKDFSAMYSFESVLPAHFKRMQISKLHNVIADRIRKEFVDWLDQLNDSLGADKEWWFESVSGRNVYESDLFQNCCYIEIIKDLFSRQSSEWPSVIFVDSKALAGVLSARLAQEKIKVVFCRHFYTGIFIKRSLLTLYNYCFFVCQLLSRVICALLTKTYRKHKKTSLESPQILIDTFIHSDSFQSSNSFSDPYYPGLYQFLQSRGYGIMIHPVLDVYHLNLYSIYKEMRKSNYNFLIPEDYLRLTDYVNIIFYPFRFFKKDIKTMPFLGTDITLLIKEERMFTNFLSSMLAVFIYRFFIRLKYYHPVPGIIINRYENQVIDRAFIFGARKVFPNAKFIGTQLFLHSLNWLNIFPTKAEIKYRLVPDLVLCTSQLQCELAKLFTDEFRCLPCAALRYSHIFDSFPDNDLSNIEKNILVLLPYTHDEALELLSLVKEAKKLLTQNIPIRIKSHPFLDMKSLSLKFGKWPGQICEKTLKEELSRALVVVGTESGSLVEAVACAIPAIFVARQNGFSQNPLVDIPDGIARMCYSSLELAEALTHYYSLPLSERSRFKFEALRIRDLYFTPVSEETLEPFLGN